MKILFLDIDGVMVLDIDHGITGAMQDTPSFHEPSVKALNDIVSKTKCEIVISSGWREFFDLEQMREIFQLNKISTMPMGFTQNYRVGLDKLPDGKELEVMRCREIMSWLCAHDVNGRFAWCAVDDMDLSFGLDKFVRCSDKHHGLSYRGNVEKIVSMLNGTG